MVTAAVGVLAFGFTVAASRPAAAAAATSATWCGSVSPADRPGLFGGKPIKVLYAIASDGVDRSAEIAPLISADVDEMEAWWLREDSSRVPRFDRAAFSCGPQADIQLHRLRQPLGELTSLDPSAIYYRVWDELASAPQPNLYKYLVYVDVPLQLANICGVGGGHYDGMGVSIIALSNCTGDIRTANVAMHELLHSFGALPASGPPHACPESPAHACDQTGDILYIYAQPVSLSSFALDVGRDDYYAHSGAWPDMQDSKWLRRLDAQVAVDIRITGDGKVTSGLSPGIDCTAACVTQWDNGEFIDLKAAPAEGLRFVRWTGGCGGNPIGLTCQISLSGPQQVTALFAPATFALATRITGKGRLAVSPGDASCTATCTRNVTSHIPVTFRPVATKGWEFLSWGGACKGKGKSCTVPMIAATSVAASFQQLKRR